MNAIDYNLPYSSRRSPVMARNLVATSQPLAAQAGVRMLLKGGNAVDAALAAAMALIVVEPTGNGLGGDAFAIVWDGQSLHGLNASGRAPAAWTPERFAGRSKMPERGWDSVTVPGLVSSWVELSAKFGKLPFEELFGPAIAYAREGFPVSPIIATLWQERGSILLDQPGFKECFMPGGRGPRPGEIFTNEALATSLELIARSKGEEFYRGSLAEKIARFAEEHGAALTREDLAEHSVDWCGTISQEFHGVDVHEIPPNGQGIATLMALGILKGTDIASFDPDSVEALHLQIEAMKMALVDAEHYVGDGEAMAFTAEELLDPERLKDRAAEIDRAKAQLPQAAPPKQGGTVYISAADADGMMVSFIQSNFNGFGSGVVVPGTGIALQNRGLGFSLKPGHVNEVAPRKRPFHTIIPGFMMKGGKPHASFGLMGGPMQAQGHLQMVLRTQLWNQNPQAASDAPRWRIVEGRKLAIEGSMDPQLIEGLRQRGHEVVIEAPDTAFGFGGAQMIQRIDGAYVAGSDHRKDGAAIGF